MLELPIFKVISAACSTRQGRWGVQRGAMQCSPLVAVRAGFPRRRNQLRKQTLNFQLLRNLTIGILLVLIGMLIPGNRKLRYILALAPLFSIIAAYLFIDPSIKGFLYQSKKILLRILLVFPYILLLL